MNKEVFIKSLKDVKLVIGNGFDLHCGLHTKYSDFYCKNIDTFIFINRQYDNYEKTETFNFDDEKMKKISVWDIFFAFNSSPNPKDNKEQWCDIEKLMLSSLMSGREAKATKENATIYKQSKIHWDVIRNCIVKSVIPSNPISGFLVEFIKHKMSMKGLYSDDFYRFLLGELKDFERRFGDFIYTQLHISWLELTNPGQEFLNDTYFHNAINAIKEMCNLNNLVSIDSFNYGNIRDQRLVSIFQNINGNIEAPIFGVDSIFEPKDERFIFTKTGRRIDSEFFEFGHEIKPSFRNLVIFGHSLNEADYSYFFPLFDRMNLTDILATNVLVFVYSIFDKEKEGLIKSRLRDALSKLLYAYALDKHIVNPNRFLDGLSIQKRIITYEIPTFQKWARNDNFIEQEWNKIYKKVDLLTKN